jgi:Fe-S oxidoreductase
LDKRQKRKSMLTSIEKIIFILVTLSSLSWTFVTFRRMIRTINRGQGRLRLDGLPRRLLEGAGALLTQGWMIRRRPLVSILHGFVAWGFLFYLLVNVTDLLEGFISGFHVRHEILAWHVYRLLGDILTVAALAGIVFFLGRRFVVRSKSLDTHENIKMYPGAAAGVARDSLIVGLFVLGHVGFRFLGASVAIAQDGIDPWQPMAGFLSYLWNDVHPTQIEVARHVCWWLALGLVLAFLPYFPYSKHAHLFMGPLNWMTRPLRRSSGALDGIDFEDETLEQFGVARLTDLSRTQILDGFACIACNRCQDVCPAYITGKELSPSALEINKRAYLKQNLKSLASGEEDKEGLMDYAISASATWACLSCGACAEACPVSNEPMFDILDIRRDQVLMKGAFPDELRGAYTGMERNGNPWQMTDDRLGWTKSLDFDVPTVEQNPDYDLLYWVGCAGAFDPTAQRVARAIATLLHRAGINFAVLGNKESCTGDVARRSGNEHLFHEMAKQNIETLNAAGAVEKRIVTGCPHCAHTLGNEYPDLGGAYDVIHHTQLIAESVEDGRLERKADVEGDVTFHDPCYLGRHGGTYDAPRESLAMSGADVREMPRNRENSFCCGGGGAQVWKEEESGSDAVSDVRYAEAKETGAETLAVGCPFCARMLGDANARDGEGMQVRDVAEIAVDSLQTGKATTNGHE